MIEDHRTPASAPGAAAIETRWWLIRHAPVVDERRWSINGQEDVAADTSDREAFATLARSLPQGAIWITTPLSRTRRTVSALRATGLDAPEPLIEPELMEQHFGLWQGTTWDILLERDDPEAREFWKAPTNSAPPGGESFADQIRRVAGAMDRLTAAHGGRDIVAVVHGGTIRSALAHALDLPSSRAMAFKMDNLRLTRIDHIASGMFQGHLGVWRVLGVNMPTCREPTRGRRP